MGDLLVRGTITFPLLTSTLTDSIRKIHSLYSSFFMVTLVV